MKLLTFLGAAKAYPTTYVMPDGREHTAPFCGVALARFYPDIDMRVFVTTKAREQHWATFKGLTEDYVASLTPVDISDGETEERLWRIFQAVVENVEAGEAVIFDITHGFRSLPFLSFLAAAYLRTVKSIGLQAVLYGNYEARDQSVQPNRAPIIDMTPFVALLDWMVAADRFVRFGDAHDLAERLRAQRPDYQAQQASDEIRDQAIRMSQAATALDGVSLALRLIRPSEAMTASAQLQTKLIDATATVQQYALPFAPLSQQVTDAFAPLALGEHEQKADRVAALARERRMVHWYLERSQYVQALAVAREWVISWAMAQLAMPELTDRQHREEVEKAFGRANDQRQRQRGAFDDETFSTGLTLRSLNQIADALKLFAELGNARNDLLHAGKRPGPLAAVDMENSVKRLCGRLDQLPLPGGGD
ncbi:MAG: TIGR02221 family CRISPR-associated protein [Caldilineales bacterium]|nr:TIGR02221 family CRISPR-associated protein [Caldilineales bacterium]